MIHPKGMTARHRHPVSNRRDVSDLRFWSPRRDSNPRPSDYESKSLRPAGTARTRSGCSRQRPRPASAFLTCRVTAGGMTKRMTGLPHRATTVFPSGSKATAQWEPNRRPCRPMVGQQFPTDNWMRHRVSGRGPRRGGGGRLQIGGRRLGRDLDSVPAGVLRLVECPVGSGDELFGGLVPVPGGHTR
jgi:hypothetical protein